VSSPLVRGVMAVRVPPKGAAKDMKPLTRARLLSSWFEEV
jgi:hypothetical protein